MRKGLLGLWVFVCLTSTAAIAAKDVPDCIGAGKPIPIDNEQVVEWSDTTPNQFQARGHVEGEISNLFEDQTGHAHFAIRIGKKTDDEVEIIYNEGFGKLPELQVGMAVEACGDYITATAKAGHYPPSPVGALIHWVHKSDSPKKHPSGFLIINDQLYGQR
jgi:hypothetical protein